MNIFMRATKLFHNDNVLNLKRREFYRLTYKRGSYIKPKSHHLLRIKHL